MPTPVLFALAAGLFMTAEAPQQNPQAAVKLWAGVGVNVPPVFHPPGRQHAMRRPDLPKRLVVHFAVVNDGAGAVNPDIESSQLLVNGKLLENWENSIRGGLRDGRWKALPAGDYLLFTYDLSNHFKAPGTYTLSWKGKDFQAADVVFRILPEDGQAKPRGAGKLWCGINVNVPPVIERLGDQGPFNEALPEKLVISLAVVNDSDKPVDPQIEETQLLLNGQVYRKPFATKKPRGERSKELPPGTSVLLNCELAERFRTPGVYKFRWKGKDFQTPEVVFRVVPGEEQ